MTIQRRTLANGTAVTQSFPWGLYFSAELLCSDGKVRRTKRISSTADTFFSVPCSVNVGKLTVSGYMTFDTVADEEELTAMFRAYTYGRNASALPEGQWKGASNG